jgi:hypothetical protein
MSSCLPWVWFGSRTKNFVKVGNDEIVPIQCVNGSGPYFNSHGQDTEGSSAQGTINNSNNDGTMKDKQHEFRASTPLRFTTNQLFGINPSFAKFNAMVRQMIGAPMAAVCLLEDMQFPAHDSSTTVDHFYSTLPEGPDVYVIENCREDLRLCKSRYVVGLPYIRFYAGNKDRISTAVFSFRFLMLSYRLSPALLHCSNTPHCQVWRCSSTTSKWARCLSPTARRGPTSPSRTSKPCSSWVKWPPPCCKAGRTPATSQTKRSVGLWST